MAQFEPVDLRKWFRHLALARADVRDELQWLGEPVGERVGDFGCGNGLHTFALAGELPTARCIGVDKHIGEAASVASALAVSVGGVGDGALACLVESRRMPGLRRGDVVTGANLPWQLDLVYCKRLLLNIQGGAHDNRLAGRDGVRATWPTWPVRFGLGDDFSFWNTADSSSSRSLRSALPTSSGTGSSRATTSDRGVGRRR